MTSMFNIFTVLIFCALTFSDGAVISPDLNQLQSLIKLPTANEESTNCTSGFLGGECTYVWECVHGKGYPNDVCRRGFQYGVCCTTRTTIRVPEEVTENSSQEDYGCGTSMVETEGRIINGSDAAFGQFPWVASLRLEIEEHNQAIHFCGATIINRNWVVTSAHCIFMYDDSFGGLTIKLRFGEHDMESETEAYPFIEREISEQVIHPDFRLKDFYSDIALMKLNKPIEYQPHIRPICLPGNDDRLAEKLGVVSGWGRLEEGGATSPLLQMAKLPILDSKACEKMFAKGSLRENISDVYMCAGFADGHKDACTGDSGGPMQLRGNDGKYFLAGIVSWGYGCARPNLPGVYTRVSQFVPWILDSTS